MKGPGVLLLHEITARRSLPSVQSPFSLAKLSSPAIVLFFTEFQLRERRFATSLILAASVAFSFAAGCVIRDPTLAIGAGQLGLIFIVVLGVIAVDFDDLNELYTHGFAS